MRPCSQCGEWMVDEKKHRCPPRIPDHLTHEDDVVAAIYWLEGAVNQIIEYLKERDKS